VLVYCPTEVALILVPVKDARGIFRFPCDAAAVPGLVLSVRPLTPILEQVFARVGAVLGIERPGLVYSVCEEDLGTVKDAGGRDATLYLLRAVEPCSITHEEWPTFPQILRSLSRDRTRLPWMKAWQVLTGGLEAQTKAIEVDDLEKFKS
jgi:hypothetical protein